MNVKMPTIVDILTFISMINTTESLKARQVFIFQHFSFYEQLKFHVELSWAWKKFYNPRARLGVPLLFTCYKIMFSCDKAYLQEMSRLISLKRKLSIYLLLQLWIALYLYRLTLFPQPVMTFVVCSLICLWSLVAYIANNMDPDLGFISRKIHFVARVFLRTFWTSVSCKKDITSSIVKVFNRILFNHSFFQMQRCW